MTNLIVSRGENSPVWKWVQYIVFAFFISFPFVMFNGFLYGGSSTRSVTLIAVSIILGILFAVWSFKQNSELSIPKSYIGLTVAVYFILLVVSGIAGLDPHTSFWSAATRTTGIWYLVHLGLVFFLLSGMVSEKSAHKRLMLSIVVSTAIYSILALLSPEGLGLIFRDRLGDGFTLGNSSFAGMYLFGAFILSLYYLFQAEIKKWWMYVLPVVLAINPFILNHGIWKGDFSAGWIGEARSSTYAFILSLVAIFVLWLISKIKNSKIRSITAYSLFGISVLAIAISAWSLFSYGGYLRGVYLEQATAARPLIWDMSEKVVAEKPLFGWGSDTFERVFELNYDNRLLQDEYGNEAWFDRAHNMFIDQLVDVGVIGLIAYLAIYLVLTLVLIRVTLKAPEKSDRILASLLIVYFALHFMELQTAFDTSISYPMIMFMLASAIVLECRVRTAAKKDGTVFVLSAPIKYIVATAIVAFSCWSFILGWIPFVRAQIANGSIRTAGDSTKRMLMYPVLFGSQVDQHSFLWRTSTDFQRGIGQNPAVLQDPKRFEGLKNEILYFEGEYRKYLAENPEHFRAHLNLADILIYERLFGVDKLKEANGVLDAAIALEPDAPQPYWMKAVAYIYMKKFDLAREYAKKAYDLNPEIKQSSEVIKYVETSIKNFPEIDLFFFRYI
ncbi:MAG: O-antigen ligase family protein [Candidatus Pacebacteria bacterium]|nr:O-antigen ligase family protein [Candidatus Paceibacterota bacterium]